MRMIKAVLGGTRDPVEMLKLGAGVTKVQVGTAEQDQAETISRPSPGINQMMEMAVVNHPVGVSGKIKEKQVVEVGGQEALGRKINTMWVKLLMAVCSGLRFFSFMHR